MEVSLWGKLFVDLGPFLNVGSDKRVVVGDNLEAVSIGTFRLMLGKETHVLLLFAELSPAAWRQMLEDLPDITLPVVNSHAHLTGVNEIEVIFGMGPFLLHVINFELDVSDISC